MTIVVESVKSFAIPNPPDDGRLELPEGSSVQEAYLRLGISADHHRPPVPFVNGVKATKREVLSESDVLFLFYPLNGG